MLLNPKCVMTFSATLLETFFILRSIWRDINTPSTRDQWTST